MYVSFSLTRPLELLSLQLLLPALQVADVVVLEDVPPRIECAVDAPRLTELEQAMAGRLAQLGEHLMTEVTDRSHPRAQLLYELASLVLTVIVPRGTELPAELTALLMEWDVELRAIRRLSAEATEGPLALEFYIDSARDPAALRDALPPLAMRWGVDLCLAPADSKRPRRRLIAFDMDSTLIECEVIDELAARAGVGDDVAAITARAMRGELDFRGSFTERMGRLRGLSAAEVIEVGKQLPIMPGAQALLRMLRAQGHHTMILSGGFDYFARRLQDRLGIHEVHANRLEIVDDALTGAVQGEIVDGERKVELLGETAAARGFSMADTVAVGDGANDLPMLAAAGLGVAFHAKPLVRERADYAISFSDLTALMFVLGVPQSGAARDGAAESD